MDQFLKTFISNILQGIEDNHRKESLTLLAFLGCFYSQELYDKASKSSLNYSFLSDEANKIINLMKSNKDFNYNLLEKNLTQLNNTITFNNNGYSYKVDTEVNLILDSKKTNKNNQLNKENHSNNNSNFEKDSISELSNSIKSLESNNKSKQDQKFNIIENLNDKLETNLDDKPELIIAENNNNNNDTNNKNINNLEDENLTDDFFLNNFDRNVKKKEKLNKLKDISINLNSDKDEDDDDDDDEEEEEEDEVDYEDEDQPNYVIIEVDNSEEEREKKKKKKHSLKYNINKEIKKQKLNKLNRNNSLKMNKINKILSHHQNTSTSPSPYLLSSTKSVHYREQENFKTHFNKSNILFHETPVSKPRNIFQNSKKLSIKEILDLKILKKKKILEDNIKNHSKNYFKKISNASSLSSHYIQADRRRAYRSKKAIESAAYNSTASAECERIVSRIHNLHRDVREGGNILRRSLTGDLINNNNELVNQLANYHEKSLGKPSTRFQNSVQNENKSEDNFLINSIYNNSSSNSPLSNSIGNNFSPVNSINKKDYINSLIKNEKLRQKRLQDNMSGTTIMTLADSFLNSPVGNAIESSPSLSYQNFIQNKVIENVKKTLSRTNSMNSLNKDSNSNLSPKPSTISNKSIKDILSEDFSPINPNKNSSNYSSVVESIQVQKELDNESKKLLLSPNWDNAKGGSQINVTNLISNNMDINSLISPTNSTKKSNKISSTIFDYEESSIDTACLAAVDDVWVD